MSDLLSEDQLDDLLSQPDIAGDAPDIPDSDEGDEGGGKDYGNLAAAFEFYDQKAGAVISNVLNREVTMTVGKCDRLDVGALREGVGDPLLMVSLPLESGLEGIMYLLVSTANVAVLADLMLMGDGTADYNEDHKDALGELFNQVMGSYTAGLGEQLGNSVSSGAIEVQEFDFDSPPFPLESADMAIVNVDLGDLGAPVFGFIVPEAMSQELMQAFSGSSGGSDEGSVGLNSSELDDLSDVASGFDMGGDDSGDTEFQEAPIGDNSLTVSGSKENIDMLLDVELDVSIELGRADLAVKRILELAPGAIVELDRLAGEPVDLLVNNKVVAKGEVVVVDENFGIRIVSLVSPEERIKVLH